MLINSLVTFETVNFGAAGVSGALTRPPTEVQLKGLNAGGLVLMHRKRLASRLQGAENGSRLFIEQEMEAPFE